MATGALETGIPEHSAVSFIGSSDEPVGWPRYCTTHFFKNGVDHCHQENPMRYHIRPPSLYLTLPRQVNSNFFSGNVYCYVVDKATRASSDEASSVMYTQKGKKVGVNIEVSGKGKQKRMSLEKEPKITPCFVSA